MVGDDKHTEGLDRGEGGCVDAATIRVQVKVGKDGETDRESRCEVKEEDNADAVEDVGMEEVDDLETEGSDGDDDDVSFIDDDDGDHSGGDAEQSDVDVQMEDAEVDDVIGELLEVESKAAEAQEALEKESLEKVEKEVREELAQSLTGNELENAVSTEMTTYIEQWEILLDDLETESSLLLEQLDGAGVDLPSLFKSIESQAPSNCYTETWRNRTHWVGSDLSSDMKESVTNAEKFLQSHRPVRRQHGKFLEEGASGFLARQMYKSSGDIAEEDGVTWSSFDHFIASQKDTDKSLLFGSKNWSAVYLASTPCQAASLGLKLPGIDEVEEIDEIPSDPFYADAVLNEKDIDLSEEQRRRFKKVSEDNDVHAAKKLHHFLNKRRLKKHLHQVVASEDGELQNELHGEPSQYIHGIEDSDLGTKDMQIDSSGYPDAQSKCCQAIVIDSDDEVEAVEKNIKNVLIQRTNSSYSMSMKDRDIIYIDADSCPSPPEAAADFHCTSCFKPLQTTEVCRHVLLGVIVCKTCNIIVEEQLGKDINFTPGYCRWCGKCIDLVNCNFCEMSFCLTCLRRNLGEKQLLESKSSSWRCCSCNPFLLHDFILECNRVLDITEASTSSGSELSISVSDGLRRRKRKRKIRRILDDTELGDETKQKIEIEKARQEHLKSMKCAQQPFKNIVSDEMNAEIINTEILGDARSGYIVNVYREQNEDAVRIPPSTSSWLKPHQIAGIRFMWQNIIQSVKKVRSGDKGLGCILAHTMGLGKTLQVITFLYSAMRSVELGLKTALIVTPVNVLHNWRLEFMKWKPTELKRLRIFMLDDVSRDKRTFLLSKWKEKGGVLLIGYATFRNLSLGKYVKDRATCMEICQALQDIPDILVCDEAHIIKNRRADTTQALKQVKTQRRIALTGSPLQNNLMEYYCMVDFVREGFLGSCHEFRNRFQNPIENGQHTNSTAADVKIMNQRSHILYEQLKGFVQRMDMNVVKNYLPPKTVYVISVKLSPLQRKLYKRFLDVHGFTKEKFCSDRVASRCFFAGYQTLAQILNHPGLLQRTKEHKVSFTHEDIVENIFEDDSSSDDNIDRTDAFDGDGQTKNGSVQKGANEIFVNEENDWWQDLIRDKIYKEADYSGKMVLLLDILGMSSEFGDKVLIFSQSLGTLDLIEMFLSKFPREGMEGKCWKQGKDWYRLDGRTAGADRQKLVERFNDSANNRVKCVLISTRAGSLGINLHAANRVIIVDGSWNPTYDLQAIYRAWRYGQVKPVYAYRLMAHGTMEEKIYKRQVTKEGLAARVVDRQQIHRTMSREEVLHLFEFGDDEIAEMGLEQNPENSDHYQSGKLASFLKQKSLSLNKVGISDKLMENLLTRHHPRWIQDYHEHEMLLQENEDEKLSKEEQDMAWETFVRMLEWEEVNRVPLEGQPTKTEHKQPQNPRAYPEYRNSPSSMPDKQQHAHNGSASSASVSRNTVQARNNSRNNQPPSRKCSNLSHLLTLRSQGTKSGSSTVCRECSMEISWENLNRDSKIR